MSSVARKLSSPCPTAARLRSSSRCSRSYDSRQVKVIAIVGELDSTLARQATVALEAYAEYEAGPLGIVPTSSVAVALAVGDALALATMEVNGVTREAFAANHPSGQLGRRLTLRVRDVAHGNERNPRISPTAPLLDALSAITDGGLGAVSRRGPGWRPAGDHHGWRRSSRLCSVTVPRISRSCARKT